MTTQAKEPTIKQELARVFDDNLHTKQWHNLVDYTIIGLIVLSTLEVFLSTYDGIVEHYGVWLKVVDYFTTAVFTIEVSLRIWCADQIDERYRGFRGRLRYCFSFYGLIDILSTYPFYVSLITPLPYTALKTLRILRLLRIFRYIKAFNILSRAVKSKRRELVVSLEFLVIVTLLLSFVLYFVEHEVQPEVYDNGWISVVWAFAQYIGDPGGFADTPPITTIGHLVAVLVGLLGIAIFAVPAGLIGSGFSEVMEEDAAEAELKETQNRIIKAFRFVKDMHHTGLFFVPRYLSMTTISTKKLITEEQIFRAVEKSDCLHLCNTALSINKIDNPTDQIVLVNFYKNTDYGCCIDRGSRITIVNTSGDTEPMSSWFAFHVAKLGGFNYVAKDIATDPDKPASYYTGLNNPCPNYPVFINDINGMAHRGDTWAIMMLSTNAPRSRPTQLHFCYNSKKGDDSYNDPDSRIKDYDTFDRMYSSMSKTMDDQFGLKCDRNQWYGVSNENIAHKLEADNVFTLRVAGFMLVNDDRLCAIVKQIADCLRQSIEPERSEPLIPEMRKRNVGHDFGMADYVEEY
ncbi:MAG: ion transporter [Bacteroidales bacterium]|nr:ion transporter [Bacteroidales bacterium]